MNPCNGVALVKIGQKRPAYMASAQFESLYGQARGLLMRTKVVVIYTTALRLREALNLTWDYIELERAIVDVARRDDNGYVQAWTPKDHERREIPLPKQVTDLLKELKALAPPDCPYVFMNAGRWDYYRARVDEKQWPAGRHIINNSLRKFKTMCSRAKVGEYTIHDLRRSCITNWARSGLPIHVTQKLAGHGDIRTTQQYYLPVQDGDLRAARRMQQKIVKGLSDVSTTDQKLTNAAQTRAFSKRRIFVDGMELPPEAEVA